MVSPYFNNIQGLIQQYKQNNWQNQQQVSTEPLQARSSATIQGGYDTGPKFSYGNWYQRNIKPNMATLTSDKSGVGAYGAMAANALPGADGEFSVDKNAGFKGSFNGLSSGGVVGAIAGGVGAQIGEMRRVNKALDNLQTSMDGYTMDANGNPIFNSEAYTAGLKAQGEIKKGQESVKLGKGLDPATAAFAGIMGTKRKLDRKAKQLNQGLAKAASDYNNADIASRGLNNQMEDYYQRMNKRNRLYNVYKTQY